MKQKLAILVFLTTLFCSFAAAQAASGDATAAVTRRMIKTV